MKMSRNLKRVVLFVIAVAGAGLTGCDATGDQCDSTTACSQSVQTCCSASACHYAVAGRTFNCAGTNCDAAARQAVSFACSRSSASEEQVSLVRQAQARAAEAAARTRP